jgi:hypothetical protein
MDLHSSLRAREHGRMIPEQREGGDSKTRGDYARYNMGTA